MPHTYIAPVTRGMEHTLVCDRCPYIQLRRWQVWVCGAIGVAAIAMLLDIIIREALLRPWP